MTKCSNCQTEFDSANEGIVATNKGREAAAVCDACMTDARLVKLVLRRGDLGGFSYEQYTAIEMIRRPAKAAG